MPRKLGQHFLKNKKKIKKIIDLLNLEDSDKVIEIGPGKGALTKEIGKRDKNLEILAIEQDKNLVDYLKNHLTSEIEENGNSIEVRYGNILTKLPPLSENLENFEEYKVVGNIPYYITGKLFRVFEEIDKKPKRIVLTIQKEVADRLVSKPPKANILSSSVQFWADVEKVMSLPKKDFDPAPEVNSAVVILTPKEYKKEITDRYYRMVRLVFKHPRKTVLNNLSIGIEDKGKDDLRKSLEKRNIDLKSRPQNLSVNNLVSLSKILTENN